MNRISTFIALFVMLLFVVSCKKEETKPLTSSSPDGKMVITVKAERTSSLEPYTAHVILHHNNEDLEVTTEVYADKIDETNVQFDWKSDKQCVVNFTQRDGVINSVPVGVNY